MIDELKLALEARLPHVYLSAEEASRQRIFLRKFLNIGLNYYFFFREAHFKTTRATFFSLSFLQSHDVRLFRSVRPFAACVIFPLLLPVSLIGYAVLHVADACTFTRHALSDLPPLTPFVQTSLRAACSQWTSLATYAVRRVSFGGTKAERATKNRPRRVDPGFVMFACFWTSFQFCSGVPCCKLKNYPYVRIARLSLTSPALGLHWLHSV